MASSLSSGAIIAIIGACISTLGLVLYSFLAFFFKRLVTQLDKVSNKLDELDRRVFVLELTEHERRLHRVPPFRRIDDPPTMFVDQPEEPTK